MDTNSFLVPSEQEVLTRSLYVHTFIISPNSESGRKILDSDHLLMALTNRFLFATILINNTNTFVLLDRFHRFHTISTDAYLDTKKSAHASRTLFNCKKAAPTINVWTFWFSIFTHPLYAKLIKLSSALKTEKIGLNVEISWLCISKWPI